MDDNETVLRTSLDVVAISNAVSAATQGDRCATACGLATVGTLLVGTDVAMRAALARVMLNAVRKLIDVINDSEAVKNFMKAVLVDAELGDDERAAPRTLR
jgi:hypothetical protein